MRNSKQELTLLGIWNILPIGNWTWFSDISLDQLEQLTGRRLGIFCYVKNNLNYECFVKKDTDLLKQDLESREGEEQLKYVQKIADNYYEKVVALEKQLKIAGVLVVEVLTDTELANHIMALAETWSTVTMQIWYAVLLDIWYPSSNKKLELKDAIAKARDHCGHLHEQSDKIEHKLYMEAAKRLGLTEREIYFMIQPEVVEALKGKKVSKKDIRSRMDLCVESNYEDRVKVYGGDVAKKVLDKFIVPSAGKRIEGDLKGSPASLGNVEGVAHVILLDKEFDSFKEGEILVSLQTMVHYVPIMKKAKAILTEFGGLTSHAAIVSRELKKPCVVGIKGLVASVKTGDLLKVDAARGVVQIIETAS